MAARYVAIIMDGNARWAAEHGRPVLEGHREGAQALKRSVRNAVQLDVQELTAYAFSTENWSRRRGRLRALPVRARDARPRPADSHERREAAVELPAVAVRLLGAGLQRDAVAGLRQGRSGRGPPRVRGARAPLRRPRVVAGETFR